MDTLLEHRDFLLDSRGLPQAIQGRQELLQRAMIRLLVHKGQFVPDPSLGSELYRLKRGSAAQMNRTAQAYIMDALSPMPQVRAGEVSCRYDPASDRINLSLELILPGDSALLEVNL